MDWIGKIRVNKTVVRKKSFDVQDIKFLPIMFRPDFKITILFYELRKAFEKLIQLHRNFFSSNYVISTILFRSSSLRGVIAQIYELCTIC